MTKRKLIAQNEELYNMLKENEANNASLKKRVDELMIMLGAKDFEINELKAKVTKLEKENSNLKSFSANVVVEAPAATPAFEPLSAVNEDNESIDTNTEEPEETKVVEAVETTEIAETVEEKAETTVKHIEVNSLEDDISKYAAKSISNISLKAAILSNTLALSQSPNAKDLLTLTLGRSEVFKQKVFEVTKSAVSYDTAKASINLLEAETIEYFEQLKAQL